MLIEKKLRTELSDGTKVTGAEFTRNVASVVTILLVYMLTSIKSDDRDRAREQYAKGSPPLNVTVRRVSGGFTSSL